MSITTSDNATIRGVAYKRGNGFKCLLAQRGKAASDGTGASSISLIQGDTYYFVGKASGSGVKYPYAISKSSSATWGSTLAWFKEDIFPYAQSSTTTTTTQTSRAVIQRFGLVEGTTRSMFVTWSWNKTSTTENYRVVWKYYSNGIWFVGNDSTTHDGSNDYKNSTYTAPDNAVKVSVKILPVSKTKKQGNTETVYWTAGWTDANKQTYDFSNNPPETPAVPSVEIDKYKLTAELDNLDLNAASIQFQIVKNNSTVFKTGTANIVTNHASYSCNVDTGHQYKVRCRSYRAGLYSDWSDYSNNIDTGPSTPKSITTCKATSSTSVYLEWPAVNNATSYDIEYTTKINYFDSSNQTSTQTGIEFTHYELTGMESGEEYFFRVRAVNSAGSSGWSEIKSVIIGSKPAAPTTWSSTTTAIVGETINLYWVHNSEDGSSQTYAELELTTNGVTETRTIKNTRNDEEKDKTSSYGINTVTFYEVLKSGDIYSKTTTILDTEPSGSTELTATTISGETVYSYVDSDNVTKYYCKNTTAYAEGAKIQWRVRTAGITKVYGDWSIQRTIDVYAPPTLELSVIDSNDNSIEELQSFPFYVSALAGPKSQVPIGYHLVVTSTEVYETTDNVGNVKMVNQGEEVYSKYFDINSDLMVEFSPNNINLENGITYTITCTITMNTGLTTESSSNLSVSWTDYQYQPNAEIGVDKDTLSAYIRPYCEDTSGDLIEGVSLSVYRREYDGSYTEIGSGIDNTKTTFVTDPHPALDYARYRIVSKTESTGAVSYYDMPGYPVEEKSVIIQWDEDWTNFDTSSTDELAQPAWSGSLLRLPYNIDVSDKHKTDVSLIEYVGRKHPVSYYGTHLGETSTWSMVIPKNDVDTLYAIRRLAIWTGDVYVREPSGSGYWANISVSFSQKHLDLTIPITLEIVRVEGGI